MEHKFILVNDKNTVNKMKSYGMKVFYEDSEMAVFLNKMPDNFNFDEIDHTKLKFTNKLFL